MSLLEMTAWISIILGGLQAVYITIDVMRYPQKIGL